MATESVTTQSPELPDHVLSGTAIAVMWQNIDRAMAALEVIAEAGRDKDYFGDAVATTAGAVTEWLVQVMQTLDQAPLAQGE